MAGCRRPQWRRERRSRCPASPPRACRPPMSRGGPAGSPLRGRRSPTARQPSGDSPQSEALSFDYFSFLVSCVT
ncbi:hypothetical protein E2C01_094030 [Portunus trituberculatus]|uniref:Uncharacterized protein n=1 Tax=Portunus trituberculatus TaxID=210409 RepID=A0A5B7JRF1_PORTR|nr:hypothetical protein [Portunus trituberculatus]